MVTTSSFHLGISYHLLWNEVSHRGTDSQPSLTQLSLQIVSCQALAGPLTQGLELLCSDPTQERVNGQDKNQRSFPGPRVNQATWAEHWSSCPPEMHG